MIIREALVSDIERIQFIRNAVRENRLSNPARVSNQDCEAYLTQRGKGWVCEIAGLIVGFSIADLAENNIWALFVHPDFDKRGAGKQLHDTMLNWYFSQTENTVWLSTAPNTRAEYFYRRAGWEEAGTYGKGEIKFEMTFDNWKKSR